MEDETMNESEAVVDESVPRVGSVVRLKSGGELMTVTDVSNGLAMCMYFGLPEGMSFMSIGGSRTIQGRRIPVACLVIA